MAGPAYPVLRRWTKLLLLAACLGYGVYLAGNALARYFFREIALSTGPNGPQTPATVGVPFERTVIPSGGRHLDSYAVTAPPGCVDAPVLLIYHGIDETISRWVEAQRFLYQHCVSSLIFDPTGSGDSSRPASFHAVREDSVSAYEFTRRHFPGSRIYVLGHSMGNGPLLDAVPHFSSPPTGILLANAFFSMRSFGGIRNNPVYRLLSYAMPDIWNNVKAVKAVRSPLMVIHSDADEVNPLAAAQRIFAAAPQPKTFILLHGYRHNALSAAPSEAWWSAPLSFLGAPRPAPAR